MKIVVIGGSGLIGSKLVTKLREQGHETVAASPNSGVNTLTGEGLAEALKGAAAVVDVTNSPSWEDAAVMKFFETSTRNLLAYEAAAGVGHHVALSVVGTERLLASGFFRAKMAQETLIKGASIPYTIIRATQFFEFVKGIADFSTDGNKVRLPLALIQPMAADDVASAVGRIATGEPVNGTVEVGGPEKFRLDELVRQFLAARKDPREVVADPQALYYGVKLSENTLLPGDAAPLGETCFEDWLSLSASQILPTKPRTTAVAAASNQSRGPQK
ncbi:MAG TPA: SDR family oxidoreductase [Candidatus Polarisedimenticolia bacterium]|nr:SDR family oxidoreductase [Candidatus Polarisedimenticolia bacterium]